MDSKIRWTINVSTYRLWRQSEAIRDLWRNFKKELSYSFYYHVASLPIEILNADWIEAKSVTFSVLPTGKPHKDTLLGIFQFYDKLRSLDFQGPPLDVEIDGFIGNKKVCKINLINAIPQSMGESPKILSGDHLKNLLTWNFASASVRSIRVRGGRGRIRSNPDSPWQPKKRDKLQKEKGQPVGSE